MPALNSQPRADLDLAVERLTAAALAVAFIDAQPEGQRAGYVKAKIKFASARKRYLAARTAYLAAYPHRESVTPQLVAA